MKTIYRGNLIPCDAVSGYVIIRAEDGTTTAIIGRSSCGDYKDGKGEMPILPLFLTTHNFDYNGIEIYNGHYLLNRRSLKIYEVFYSDVYCDPLGSGWALRLINYFTNKSLKKIVRDFEFQDYIIFGHSGREKKNENH